LRFVDASVFVYAFLKPRRAHAPHELEAKEAAKRIVRRINEGEKVVLTVAQLVEIANVPEKRMGEAAYQVERFLLARSERGGTPSGRGYLYRGA